MKILPDEIPDDAAPLTEIPLETNRALTTLREADGQNVFVSLFTGKTLVGSLEWHDANTISVGNSDLLDVSIVETARIV